MEVQKKDSHYQLPYVKNYQEILTKDIKPFEAAIKKGCDAIMVSHLVIRKLTNHLPASISQKFLKKYLRERYNYNGLIITDELRMKSISLYYKPILINKAITSGTDIILIKYKKGDQKILTKIIKKAQKNPEIEKIITTSASRILSIKEKYQINDNTENINCNIKEINSQIENLNSRIN